MKSRPNKFLVFFLCSLISHFATNLAAAQQLFSTPQETVEALWQAVNNEDQAALTKLFGSNFMQYISTGDSQADRLGLQQLATLMRQGYKLAPRGARTIQLELGGDQWPFPLKVIFITNRGWTFDLVGGAKELLRRRIETNERRAIQISQFYAVAQKQYLSMIGSYAPKFLSSPGNKDGLYWETGPDGIASPLEPLVTRAENLGYVKEGNQQPLLMGYYYRVLTSQGEFAPGKTRSYLDANGRMTKGFALLAYPSRYRISGNTCYIVGENGVVYARDLGEKTEQIAPRIKQFDPDSSWHPIAGLEPSIKKMKITNTNRWEIPFGAN